MDKTAIGNIHADKAAIGNIHSFKPAIGNIHYEDNTVQYFDIRDGKVTEAWVYPAEPICHEMSSSRNAVRGANHKRPGQTKFLNTRSSPPFCGARAELRGLPRAFRAWPLAWPLPSGPLGWQRAPGGQWRARKARPRVRWDADGRHR